MYKVAIVDDEPVIVRGLTKMIPWESYNCRVVGTAGDGQEGMKLIREQKPDILISDICMPGIDGLTMIAGMKSEFGHMQITILTGFRDFDYAQQAIRLGVTRFLLKPSKMDELEEAVRVMIENLEKQGITGKEDGTDEGVGENTPKAEGNREGEEGKETAEPSEGKEGEETDSPASCFRGKLQGEAEAFGCGGSDLREPVASEQAAEQAYRPEFF